MAIVLRQICNHIDKSMKRHKMNDYSAERGEAEGGESIDEPAAAAASTTVEEDGRQDDVQRRRRRLQQPPPVVMATSMEDGEPHPKLNACVYEIIRELTRQ